jgi:polysaccharide export outer membrane protein
MTRMLMRCLGAPLAALLLSLAAGAPAAHAEDYVLGPEDVLQVSVWMHPELEKTVTVSSEGTITYPPIGDLKVGGLTPSQLATRLGDKLSTYLRQTTTVTVTVTQYLSHSVYVQGAVAKPGRYGFEKIPGLIDVLSQAGGANPGADLSSVQIVRRDGAMRRTQNADVMAVLRDGDTSKLPVLQPGDLIIVAAGAGAGMASATSGQAAAVLGEVNRPGLYPISEFQDLWVVLALAGGLTGKANYGDVRVISTAGPGPVTVVKLNLSAVMAHGAPSAYRVKPGDVVVATPTGSGAGAKLWRGITEILAVSRDVVNIVVLSDVIRNR